MKPCKARRALLQGMGVSAALGLGACTATSPHTKKQPTAPSFSPKPAHVVVIGGGFGGVTAAKHLKKITPQINVTLIEYNPLYVSGPASNWVLGGLRHVNSITFNYDSLISRDGITVINEWVSAIDVEGKNVRLSSGDKIHYDRLIVSPGIDFKFEEIEGYGKTDTTRAPHAWKSGKQTALLRQQLKTMRNGGTVVIAPPKPPYRCLTAPYERVSMIAHYLKRHKPKSKVLILDAKPNFPQQENFIQGWETLYGYGTDKSLIEFVAAPDGEISKVDIKKLITYSKTSGEQVKADVLNIIPPQEAGLIAKAAHLTDESGWCPVNPVTAESTQVPYVHVIGDAANQSPLPKSGVAAYSTAIVCAASIAAIFNDHDPLDPHWTTTCGSLLAPDYGISVNQTFKLGPSNKLINASKADRITPTDGGFSAEASSIENRWHRITQDIFS